MSSLNVTAATPQTVVVIALSPLPSLLSPPLLAAPSPSPQAAATAAPSTVAPSMSPQTASAFNPFASSDAIGSSDGYVRLFYLEPVGRTFTPSTWVVHAIRDIIRSKYDQP